MLKLADIIGQQNALKTLRGAIAPGKSAHAYLFVGQKGVGKRASAMAWARALFCDNPGEGETADACGVCSPCQKIEHGNFPDLHMIVPEVRKGQVKEQISIEAMRELINKLSFRPYEAKRKIAIIDGMEKMNTAAANSFLKTLEEPPGDTVMILICVNLNAMLPTIISRCQTIRFQPTAYKTVVRFLMDHHGMDEREAGARAALSRGSVGIAIEEAGDESLKLRSLVLATMEKSPQMTSWEIYALAKAMDRSKDKTETDRFLMIFQEILRDLLIIKTTGMYDSLVNIDIASDIGAMATRHSERRLLRGYTVAERMIEARAWNINPLLVISSLMQEFQE